MKNRYELGRCEAIADALLSYKNNMISLAKDTEALLNNLEDLFRYMDRPIYLKYASKIMNSLHQLIEISFEAEETAAMIKDRMWEHVQGTEPLRPPWY